MARKVLTVLILIAGIVSPHSGSSALERPDMEFKIFQFPKNMIPHIDGDSSDWDIVGETYTYRTDQLDGTRGGHPGAVDTADIDISVKVGWVKGLNRLYFLYEAYDDYWDFGLFDEEAYSKGRGYQNDIFEICVDADLSGGPFIQNPQIEDVNEGHSRFAGVHAQNYHIFTPPINNQWCLVWGCQPWIAEFPWANYEYSYDFKPTESGRLTLECWITPFDHASYDGPENSVISNLVEDTIVAISWAVLDFENGKKDGPGNSNLAHNRDSVKDASALCAFRLMPLEKEFLPDLKAGWSFDVIDSDRRLVYFKDESIGEVTEWLWHFGDGETSTEQNPVHRYEKPGFHYTVWLDVKSKDVSSRHSKHWEVIVK
ncbi:PKD domain-containing protein [Candidatus Latescibacterota bacterium]